MPDGQLNPSSRLTMTAGLPLAQWTMTGSWSSFTRSMTAERLARGSVEERVFMGVRVRDYVRGVKVGGVATHPTTHLSKQITFCGGLKSPNPFLRGGQEEWRTSLAHVFLNVLQ